MIKINLLETPKEKEMKAVAVSVAPSVSSIIIFGIIIVIVGIVISAILWYQAKTEFEKSKEQLEQAKKEKNELEPYIKQVVIYEKKKDLLKAKKDAIDLLRKNRSMPVHILDEVAKSVPQFLWLDALSVKGTSIELKGACTNKLDPSEFVRRLEESDFFSNVRLIQVNLNPGESGKETYSFSIVANIVNPFQQEVKSSQ